MDDYQSQKAESQQDEDTRFIEYWEGTIQTIYEVAAALHIPFEDPWRDPSWVRSAEYQALQRTTRTGKQQRRKREAAGSDHAS